MKMLNNIRPSPVPWVSHDFTKAPRFRARGQWYSQITERYNEGDHNR